MLRRFLVALAVAASTASLCPQIAFAENEPAYPSRAVRIIVPFTAGGGLPKYQLYK